MLLTSHDLLKKYFPVQSFAQKSMSALGVWDNFFTKKFKLKMARSSRAAWCVFSYEKNRIKS